MFQAKEKENSVMMLLDQEITGLKEKKKVLSEVCKHTDMSQMKLLLTKGNDCKLKCDENETEIRSLKRLWLHHIRKKRKSITNNCIFLT